MQFSGKETGGPFTTSSPFVCLFVCCLALIPFLMSREPSTFQQVNITILLNLFT